jgi:hypothetical protein
LGIGWSSGKRSGMNASGLSHTCTAAAAAAAAEAEAEATVTSTAAPVEHFPHDGLPYTVTAACPLVEPK